MRTLLKSKYANPMKKLIKYMPPMSRTDKLCALLLAGCFLAPNLAVWAMDEATCRAAEADKPPAQVITVKRDTIDCTPLVEAIEAMKADQYDETIPLDRECQEALWEACEANNIAPCLVLGLIEVESNFHPDVVSSEGCTGLMQLNRRYYPDDLTPPENIAAGVEHLARELERYEGDNQAALRAYNRGYDDGDREYSRKVLAASEKWGNG